MKKTIIIGGGAVGLFTAWYLLKKGIQTTVIDQGDFTEGCSYGNAGLIVPSHIIPMASPGMLKKGIKSLIQPGAPVTVNPRLNFKRLNWLLRFSGSANSQHVRDSIPVLKELSLFSRQLYEEIRADGDLIFPFWDKGLLMLFKSIKTGEELFEEADLARQAGLKVSELTLADIHRLEPESKPDVTGGFHYHADAHLNPREMMLTLVEKLEQAGVEIIRNCKALAILENGKKAIGLQTTQGNFNFEQIVITAGMWSPELLQPLKLRLPVQPGKGYSFRTTTHKEIKYPALLSDVNVAVTPLGNQLTQFGGGMELGYGDKNIKQTRIRHIAKSVGEFYPTEKNTYPALSDIWLGHRPCSFDGLPFIGRLKNYPNVYLGTGHSMMGITLAPATGYLLTELIEGKSTTLNLTSFRPER